MKKIILTLCAVSMFFAVGCSSEEDATNFNETTEQTNLDPKAARGTAWNGEIGIEDNGVFKITADEAALKADLTATLQKEGYNTTVQTLAITKLAATNTTGDSGFMLIGSDGIRTSIGVWLVKGGSQFTMDTSFTNSTTCTGCAQGCNLSYVRIDGQRVAYCAENGCTYDCTKSESSM
jgi:hypothetical protein